MPIAHEHEIHKRRMGRNLGVGLVLAGFVAIVFALTVVKVSHLDHSQITPAGAQP